MEEEREKWTNVPIICGTVILCVAMFCITVAISAHNDHKQVTLDQLIRMEEAAEHNCRVDRLQQPHFTLGG